MFLRALYHYLISPFQQLGEICFSIMIIFWIRKLRHREINSPKARQLVKQESRNVESGCMFDTTSVVFKFQCVVEPLEKIVKPKWWDPTKRLGISRSGVEFQISISGNQHF